MLKGSTVKYNVDNLEPGMVLGKDVQSSRGAVLLPANIALTDYAISKLQVWRVNFVEVAVPDDASTLLEKAEPVDELRDENPADKAFFEMYKHAVDNIGAMFEQMRIGKKIPLQEYNIIAEKIMEQTVGVHGVLSRLREVKRGDNYTYNHSLNVGIYSILLASWLDYDEKSIRQLAMAGLLHDIGKAKIPAEVLNKPGTLTQEEFSEIKKHPLYGYQMAENTVGISRNVGMGIAQHHEREDGSGYPLKLDAKNIHPYAKIIAVADVYDALTSDRVYRPKTSPYLAADLILEESFKTLAPDVVRKFVQHVTTYFFNDRVRLNTGVIGTVVHIDPYYPTRPLLQTEQGFVDLREKPALFIIELL